MGVIRIWGSYKSCPQKTGAKVLEGVRHLLMRANGGWVWSRDDLRGLDDGAGEGTRWVGRSTVVVPEAWVPRFSDPEGFLGDMLLRGGDFEVPF